MKFKTIYLSHYAYLICCETNFISTQIANLCYNKCFIMRGNLKKKTANSTGTSSFRFRLLKPQDLTLSKIILSLLT